MSVDSDGRANEGQWDPDIETLPGWKSASPERKLRIIRAAEKYLAQKDPKSAEWFGKNIIPPDPVLIGYRALLLTYEKARPSLEKNILHKWIPLLIEFPSLNEDYEVESRRELLKLAYSSSPATFVDYLITLIDEENKRTETIFVIRKLDSFLDERLRKALLHKAKDHLMKPGCMRSILEFLLGKNYGKALDFIESLITLPVPCCGERREKALIASYLLILHRDDQWWHIIWPVIQEERIFGRELFQMMAQRSERSDLDSVKRLSEEQLKDLFVWLSHEFPYEEDPDHSKVRHISDRESMARWRDALFSHIVERGTIRACEVIPEIIKEFPRRKWLRWSLTEAQTNTRQKTWIPPEPRDILELAASREKRLVQNGEQLLDLLIESLRRFEVDLQGETSISQALWDIPENGVCRPKNEAALSDFAKYHLIKDIRGQGILFNREVEIRRRIAKGKKGERIDIHVGAVGGDPDSSNYLRITAIIEVKGCWNKNLLTDINDQLLERYLKDNQCNYGLYLVGWYDCLQWDEGDDRRKQSKKVGMDRNEVQEFFNEKAAALSKGGKVIKAIVINCGLR